MRVFVDTFEPERQRSLAEEEELLARMAQMYGSGCDEYAIARTLHVGVAFVRHVLRTEEARP